VSSEDSDRRIAIDSARDPPVPTRPSRRPATSAGVGQHSGRRARSLGLVVLLVVAVVPPGTAAATGTGCERGDVTLGTPARQPGDACAPSTPYGPASRRPTSGVAPSSTAAPNATQSSTATRPGSPPNATGPAIRVVYPNPVADDDVGEYVVVYTPSPVVLADGEGRYRVPAGTVALSATPAAARNHTDRPVVATPGLALSNAGERLRLLARSSPSVRESTARGRPGSTDADAGSPTPNDTPRDPARNATVVVAAVEYGDAPEGELFVPGTGWRSPGYDPRPVRRFGPTNATAFVLPDAPGPPVETLRAADDRILLAAYTFTSRRIADALVDAARRGVRVRVLVEGDPVDGLTTREAAILDRLVAAGVDVRALAGPRERYEFHHPKYAVVDDRVLVTTENWKPAGTGGRSSRGWGVRVDSRRVASELATVFEHDADWRSAIHWRTYREGRSFTTAPVANGSYPSRFDPGQVRAREVAVLTAPGNAEAATVDLIDGAGDRVLVEQPGLGGIHQPFVQAVLRAARRGVDVRILLSSAWYAREENRRLVERLEGLAERRGLPLSARLAEPAGRYGKIHAKGLVVDDAVVVGSLNWNNHSARENREVALVLRGEGAADYYARVFEADWRGRRPVPVLLALALLVTVGVALAVLRRRVSFAASEGGPDPVGGIDRRTVGQDGAGDSPRTPGHDRRRGDGTGDRGRAGPNPPPASRPPDESHGTRDRRPHAGDRRDRSRGTDRPGSPRASRTPRRRGVDDRRDDPRRDRGAGRGRVGDERRDERR